LPNTNKVLICGFYGNYNLGDEAMLAGMINLLQRVNDWSFTVLSKTPQDTEHRHAVRAIAIDTTQRRQWLDKQLAIISNPYFILGGGDLLRDSVDYSIAKFWLAYLQKAIMLRHRTLLLGVSVGEIWRAQTKQLIPQILNQVDILTVRDLQSKIKLEQLGVTKQIHLIGDLALEAIPQLPPTNRPTLKIGISLRHLSDRGLTATGEHYSTMQQTIAEVADYLVERYQAEIHFFPLRTHPDSYHPTDDDYVSILSTLRYSKHSEKMNVHRYIGSLDEFYQLVNNLDLMIGMRLHSLIIAAGLNVPMLAAEYDPKVRGFMTEINCGERSIPLSDFTTARVLPLVESILNNSPAERQQLAASVRGYREKMTAFEGVLTHIKTNK
jgi:polysaccharide pyruvyl transferase CsaB